MWMFTVYQLLLTTVEKMERTTTSYVKWLEISHFLANISLYGNGILELPNKTLTENYKCSKVGLQRPDNQQCCATR